MDRAAEARLPLETMTRCRIDHTAIGGGGSIELCRPVGQIETRLISEVATVLSEAEAAARRGRYVAGFVAYDAAPAFDAAFRVKTSSFRGPKFYGPKFYGPEFYGPKFNSPKFCGPKFWGPAHAGTPARLVRAVRGSRACSSGVLLRRRFIKPRPDRPPRLGL